MVGRSCPTEREGDSAHEQRLAACAPPRCFRPDEPNRMSAPSSPQPEHQPNPAPYESNLCQMWLQQDHPARECH